jgi:hypothetical protein
MRKLLPLACHPVCIAVATGAVAAAMLAGTQAAAIAAPTSGAAVSAVKQVVAAQATQEFDGFGEGRSAFIALRAARNDARQQATAAGYSTCTTGFEESQFDSGFGTFVAESDIFCTM